MNGIAECIIIRSVMPFQKQSRRHNNRSEADKKTRDTSAPSFLNIVWDAARPFQRHIHDEPLTPPIIKPDYIAIHEGEYFSIHVEYYVKYMIICLLA